VLKTYRRHLKHCAHGGEGREYRRCKCPVWVEGVLKDRGEIRESLRTNDWQKAQEMAREMEAPTKPVEEAPVTIQQACTAFLDEAKGPRQLKAATVEKYDLLLRRLQEFACDRGLRFVTEFDLVKLRDFRSSWPDHNLSAQKKLERLRGFFRFCEDSGWITANPAVKLKSPKITAVPTLPFSQEEVQKILGACLDYPHRPNAVRLRALVLLLRYTGLRIRDAVCLRRDRICNDRLFLRTAKTGTTIWLPLPPAVTEALDAIPAAGAYFFWTGQSDPKTCVGDWQRSLKRLFELAGLPTTRADRQAGTPTAHAHRLRDTFAVELLLAGVPLERVSALLGHQSIKVTEKHYSPWVRARQEQLEADVRRTWDVDLVASTPTNRTRDVHGEVERPN
jgi:integrase/recombinase XerD